MGWSVKGYPYCITININKGDFRPMLAWLHNSNHVLRETMHFGKSHHHVNNDYVTQDVWFKDANSAMIFKLAWGGV